MIKRLLLVGRILVGIVFIYAAYTKLRHPWELFALSIDSYRLLPEWAVIAVARTLPWAELVLGILLIVGIKLKYSAAAATGILAAFMVIMVRAYMQDLGIDCGCFGIGQALGPGTLIRDSLLLLLSLGVTIGAFVVRKPPSVGPRGS